jgi:hypothetical protein
MTKEAAPKPNCNCAVCLWAKRRIESERAFEADLAENYRKFLAGELVSRDEKD